MYNTGVAMNKRIKYLLFSLVTLIFAKGYLLYQASLVSEKALPVNELSLGANKAVTQVLPQEKESDGNKKALTNREFPVIPFYVQAPLGQWSDPIFQNACEEASMLMVVDALKNKKSSSAELAKELYNIALWQQENFGTSVDTDTKDVMETLQGYFGVGSTFVEEEVTSATLQNLLKENKVILAPLNGQRLGNPYFTPPGPQTHMVVIWGYDQSTKAFRVHDPGTRWGEGYQYQEEVLVKALGDYPTGNHLPSQDPLPKRVVTVWQE
jgi:hypothetical protein